MLLLVNDITTGLLSESLAANVPPSLESTNPAPKNIEFPLKCKSLNFLVGEPRSYVLSVSGIMSPEILPNYVVIRSTPPVVEPSPIKSSFVSLVKIGSPAAGVIVSISESVPRLNCNAILFL